MSGDIAQIQAAGPRYLSTPVILEADICSSCPNHATTDLRLQHVAVNKKGESTTNTVLHLSYPEEALPQLEPMFAPRTVATSGQSQASE